MGRHNRTEQNLIMLALSRHKGQRVFLKDRDTQALIAEIVVLSITKQGTVRLGFSAPQSVQVTRDDIKKEFIDGKSNHDSTSNQDFAETRNDRA